MVFQTRTQLWLKAFNDTSPRNVVSSTKHKMTTLKKSLGDMNHYQKPDDISTQKNKKTTWEDQHQVQEPQYDAKGNQ